MSTPVYISIYDMYTMNNYISAIGVGVYHSGVEVFGKEYGYGGHPFPFSGIFEMIPRDVDELGETFRFKQSIEIGKTDFTQNEIEQIIVLLGREFRGIDYHLMNKNCNHFADKLCRTLCGVELPPWVNRLAYLTTFVPFIERIIPKEWISPIAVQHTVETHIHEHDENNYTTTTTSTTSTNSTSTNNSTINLNSTNATSNGINYHHHNATTNGNNSQTSEVFQNLNRLSDNNNENNNNNNNKNRLF